MFILLATDTLELNINTQPKTSKIKYIVSIFLSSASDHLPIKPILLLSNNFLLFFYINKLYFYTRNINFIKNIFKEYIIIKLLRLLKQLNRI